MELNALVVDDSGIMRKLVMRSLTESKLATFMFTEACDGRDALTKFNPETTDVIFVDWNMPNMTGIELVKTIRQTQKRHVPIVMVTTESTMGKVEEALDQGGVDSYVVKPFTTDIIRQKIEPLFEKIAESRKKDTGFFGKLSTKFA
jgi:two-component system, chemotaxis family, chemotaxis protein CheY